MALSLSSLKKGREIKPPIIFVYGVHGIGKSTFAANAYDPVFIPTEDGLGTLDVVKFPKANTMNDVFDAIGVLAREDHTFKTCVLDSIDWFERLVHNHIRSVEGDKIFGDYGKGYTFAAPHFDKLLQGLTYLRDKKNMSIIVLGHERIENFGAPDSPSYHRYAPDLHKSICDMVQEWADAVFFVNYKTYVNEEKGGFGTKNHKATGKGDRVIYTQERPPFKAKNRYNLPAEIPLSFDAFVRSMKEGLDLVQASKTQVPQPRKVEEQEEQKEEQAASVATAAA